MNPLDLALADERRQVLGQIDRRLAEQVRSAGTYADREAVRWSSGVSAGDVMADLKAAMQAIEAAATDPSAYARLMGCLHVVHPAYAGRPIVWREAEAEVLTRCGACGELLLLGAHARRVESGLGWPG